VVTSYISYQKAEKQERNKKKKKRKANHNTKKKQKKQERTLAEECVEISGGGGKGTQGDSRWGMRSKQPGALFSRERDLKRKH